MKVIIKNNGITRPIFFFILWFGLVSNCWKISSPTIKAINIAFFGSNKLKIEENFHKEIDKLLEKYKTL